MLWAGRLDRDDGNEDTTSRPQSTTHRRRVRRRLKRGVTELAIASIGLQAHLIGPYAFAMLCALAIVTTAVTAPLYRAINSRAKRERLDTSRDEVQLVA